MRFEINLFFTETTSMVVREGSTTYNRQNSNNCILRQPGERKKEISMHGKPNGYH